METSGEALLSMAICSGVWLWLSSASSALGVGALPDQDRDGSVLSKLCRDVQQGSTFRVS
jgi:hypothetical protein